MAGARLPPPVRGEAPHEQTALLRDTQLTLLQGHLFGFLMEDHDTILTKAWEFS